MKSTTEYIRLLKQFKDNHASRYGIQDWIVRFRCSW